MQQLFKRICKEIVGQLRCFEIQGSAKHKKAAYIFAVAVNTLLCKGGGF